MGGSPGVCGEICKPCMAAAAATRLGGVTGSGANSAPAQPWRPRARVRARVRARARARVRVRAQVQTPAPLQQEQAPVLEQAQRRQAPPLAQVQTQQRLQVRIPQRPRRREQARWLVQAQAPRPVPVGRAQPRPPAVMRLPLAQRTLPATGAQRTRTTPKATPRRRGPCHRRAQTCPRCSAQFAPNVPPARDRAAPCAWHETHRRRTSRSC